MPRVTPAAVVVGVIVIALAVNGVAGIASATGQQDSVLGKTIVVAKDFDAGGAAYVTCPKGY